MAHFNDWCLSVDTPVAPHLGQVEHLAHDAERLVRLGLLVAQEGTSAQEGDVRQFGMAKEGLIARQVMLGVVQTGDGLPLYHEVFAGNTAESPTLLPTLKTVLEA